MRPLQRAVFLDRDGVINRYVCHPEFGTIDSPANPQQFELLPGVGQAIRLLNNLEFLVIVVSNQPGIAKRKFTPAVLDAITRKMAADLRRERARLDEVIYCRHHPDAVLPQYRRRCACRKPLPGMLTDAAVRWNIDLGASYMVGDGITDIVAGKAAGCTTLLVGVRKCYLCEELARQNAEPDSIVPSLLEAARLIAGREAGVRGEAVSSEELCKLKPQP